MKRLADKGYDLSHDPEKPNGEYVVVNTCGFINDAKEESINVILGLIQQKKKGRIGKIIVMGCLSERYLEDLKEEIKEVDEWYGKYNWKEFSDKLPSRIPDQSSKDWERILTTPAHSTFIKISEGCNRFCAFCAIPSITGIYTSRPIEEIVDEVRTLAESGVKEFNLIAQDLSSYGKDLYGEPKLAELTDKLSSIKGVSWIRLHYLYPGDFPLDVLDVMNQRDNVCKYLDLPLQHISDKVLENMKRKFDREATLKLLNEIRRKVPGIKLRTTLMTGFPGEGEKEFKELIEFIKEQKFDRLGAFAYSEEDGTLAAKTLKDETDDETKQRRLSELMEVQQDISLELNRAMIGTIQRVIIDRVEGEYAYGRSQYDSPEVDQEIIIKDKDVRPGEFIDVMITEAYPFELEGSRI